MEDNTLGDAIQYRDPDTEKVVTKLITDPDACEEFIRDRVGYVSRAALPVAARNALLQISDEQLRRVGAEFRFNLGASFEGSNPCGSSTFGDFFCDS